uniref:RanBP2-type domain-containing protein n=1 Tax=Calcidiscus leptoporus TaxID=127549 RepID=A0A7S0IN53_9EUKA|mmetsp:Transcript_13762/g.31612  ORF Transcript_13762/g.31612 Transcript_13762/m.31612 type:complete len:275 (+) Transcript_13762:47-871(+)
MQHDMHGVLPPADIGPRRSHHFPAVPAPPAGFAGGREGTLRNIRPGDWICQLCANHNFADKQVKCNRCHVPKAMAMSPVGGVAPMQAGRGMHASQMGLAGRNADMISPQMQMQQLQMQMTQLQMTQRMQMQQGGGGHLVGGAASGGWTASPGGQKMRPGDWICHSCSNHNYADKLACNRCRIPKAGLGANMRPGDWICRACGNHNYSDRTACNRCGLDKTVYIASTGMRQGDWICAACKNHNYADKTACNKCKAPKATTSVPGVGRWNRDATGT